MEPLGEPSCGSGDEDEVGMEGEDVECGRRGGAMTGEEEPRAAPEADRGVVVEELVDEDHVDALRTGVDDAITGAEVEAFMLSFG